jgi:hypothetical protein
MVVDQMSLLSGAQHEVVEKPLCLGLNVVPVYKVVDQLKRALPDADVAIPEAANNGRAVALQRQHGGVCAAGDSSIVPPP